MFILVMKQGVAKPCERRNITLNAFPKKGAYSDWLITYK